MTLQELFDEKGRLANLAEDVLKKARDEKRFDLTEDEDRQFDQIHKDIDKLSARIAAEQKQAAAMASLSESNGRRSEPNPTDHTHTTRRLGQITDRDRGEAMRAWMTAGHPELELTQAQRDNAKRCGINVDAKRVHLSLPSKAMGASRYAGSGLWVPSADDRRDWDTAFQEERAALTGLQSTTTTGGYTTADETMRALEVALLAFGGVRSVATVIRTATGGPLPIPTTNDTSNKGEIIGENTTSNELEMTFGQLVLDAWKYSSKYILASIEFLQDTSINANQFLGNALADRIGRITNDHFTTGSGSQPNGIVTAAASGVTSVADPPTYDNFVDLVHSIDPAYRANGRFMMNDAMLKTVKKIKVLQYSGDPSGVPLWSPSLVAGQPDQILGYPFVINQSMASPGGSAKKVIFGDLSKYIVRDVKDITLIRLDELFAVLGQVAFLALSRHDGDLLNAGTNPVKYMQQA